MMEGIDIVLYSLYILEGRYHYSKGGSNCFIAFPGIPP